MSETLSSYDGVAGDLPYRFRIHADCDASVIILNIGMSVREVVETVTMGIISGSLPVRRYHSIGASIVKAVHTDGHDSMHVALQSSLSLRPLVTTI